jgi:hypothetical protein
MRLVHCGWVVLLLNACEDPAAVIEAQCPPSEDFAVVSGVLEKRCGTLDCHGSAGRPLRIYGNQGLRARDAEMEKDPGYYPGGSVQTTDLERSLNYRAVCALEPEIISEVVAGERDPGELTLVRKARLQEKHKGGRIFDEGTVGDQCMTGWLDASTYKAGSFDGSPCEKALNNNN